MKKLLSTTALVVALGVPALALAQTTTTTTTQSSTTQQQSSDRSGEQSGFLSVRGQSDLFASELMGHDVYAHRSQADATASRDGASTTVDRTDDRVSMNRADLDNMESIGQVNEIVLSHDGQVLALVIGVGGFLGMGERDVAVSMDQVTFTSDADDRSQMYVIVNTGADRLQDAPEYDRSARDTRAQGDDAVRDSGTTETRAAARSDQTGSDQTRNDQTGSDRQAFAAPQMQRDGYDRVEVSDVSTEMLMGKSVYDVNDNDVGSVHDMIIGEDGTITNVIIDFGGFLGIGSSQAALHFDELTILSTEGNASVRLYVDATKEQIQALPQYMAAN